MKLDDRKWMILQAIIDDYIMTAVPVGSRTLSRKSGMSVSPATIRNEMSDLEDLGYLAQPHTSAGRIPSAKAYRFYVDQLSKANPLSAEENERIKSHLRNRSAQMEQVISRAAQALSEMTQYTAIVAAPRINDMQIVRVQMVPISPTSALLVVVTDSGLVKDSVIRIPEGMMPDHLYNISQMLTAQLHGLTLQQMRSKFSEIFKDLKAHRRLLAGVLDALETRLQDDEGGELMTVGGMNILHLPEYADIEKARSFLSILEEKEKLYPILRRAGGMEFSIRIGPENDLPELSECSLVTATYKIQNDVTGTIGIIGPTRMNYGRVISVLDCISKAMSDILS